MKQRLLLSVLLMLFVGIKVQAATWTDENGVTWRFDQGTLTINGEKQQLWILTGASGYGEHVIIPEVMYNGETPCTIEALGVDGSNYNLFAMNVRHVTSITLPSTLKYIGGNALTMYSGKLYVTGTNPPELYRNSASDCIGEGITVVVPDEFLDTYRGAPGWSDMAVRILNQSVKTDYIVSTTAMPSASGLHAVIGEENLGNVMSLKVSGTINSYDFIVMRNKMHNLHELDLTDATIKANSYAYYQTYTTSDNTIGKYAFYKLPKLMTVKLPTSIKTVENQAFNTCQGLIEVVCQGDLTTISDYAFSNCYRLQTVTLNDRLQTIGRDAFHDCYELKSLTLGEDFQSIEACAFYNCNSLKTVTAQGNAFETIMDEAFWGCSALKTVTLKTGIKTIAANVFRGCTNLTSINLPEGLTTLGAGAFRSCSSLPSIDIPEGVTSIGEYTFFSCTNLASVTLPNTLKYIWNYAFTNCI